MRIQVEAHTPDPITLCAKASYISHSNLKITQIFSGDTPKNPLNYLNKILKMGHLSVLEHAYFNILIEDAPVTAEIFAIQYRLASFTVKSRRYTDVIKDGFYPVTPAQNKIFLQKVQNFYQKMLDLDIPLEDARFILPYSFKTNFIMTMNARELGYFLCESLNQKALPEMHQIARAIIDATSSYFPVYKENLSIFQRETLLFKEQKLTDKRFKPLNEVEILNSTPSPDLFYQNLLSFPAYGSYNEIIELSPALIEESLKFSHNRALEALSFTFYLGKVTLAGLTHILRHRMHSPLLPPLFSPGLNYHLLVPPSIKKEGLQEEFLELAALSHSLENSENNIYYRLVAAAFPMLTTINARELYHFFKLRLCERAQWEIRELAEKMLLAVKQKAPLLFAKAGPSCVVLGYCPEGDHTCGKFKEMREKYGL